MKTVRNTPCYRPLPRSARIRVFEAMQGVLTCSRDTSPDEVAALMADRHVHCVVVTDDDVNAVWGIVSDLDVAAAASVRDYLAEQTADATAATAALTIEGARPAARGAADDRARRHHLVVVDRDHRPVGVLSTLDIARALAQTEA